MNWCRGAGALVGWRLGSMVGRGGVLVWRMCDEEGLAESWEILGSMVRVVSFELVGLLDGVDVVGVWRFGMFGLGCMEGCRYGCMGKDIVRFGMLVVAGVGCSSAMALHVGEYVRFGNKSSIVHTKFSR